MATTTADIDTDRVDPDRRDEESGEVEPADDDLPERTRRPGHLRWYRWSATPVTVPHVGTPEANQPRGSVVAGTLSCSRQHRPWSDWRGRCRSPAGPFGRQRVLPHNDDSTGNEKEPKGPMVTRTGFSGAVRANAMRAMRTSVAASANPPRMAASDILVRRPRCSATTGPMTRPMGSPWRFIHGGPGIARCYTAQERVPDLTSCCLHRREPTRRRSRPASNGG